MIKSNLKNLLRINFGNIIEWYDFGLYGYFSTIFAQQFFPKTHHTLALIAVLLTFALGIAVRPLGAIIFGQHGDKRSHHKAFLLSVNLIAIPSFLMGLLPSYHQIGIIAPILLVLLRICQGICAGGQSPGAILMLTELSNKHHRALSCSSGHITILLGYLLAASMALISLHLTPEKWHAALSWRIPFLLCALFFIFNFLLTRNWSDKRRTPNRTEGNIKLVLPLVLKNNLKEFGLSASLAAVGGAFYFSFFIFLVTFMVHFTDISLHQALLIISICSILSGIIIVPLAFICDKVGRKPLLFTSCFALLLISYPAILLLSSGQWSHALMACLSFTVLDTVFIAAINPVYRELFPHKVAYTGCLVSYNLGNAILGGTSPALITLFIHYANTPKALAYYIGTVALVGFLITFKLPETYRHSL